MDKEWRQRVSQAKRPERKDASKADLKECSLQESWETGWIMERLRHCREIRKWRSQALSSCLAALLF